MSGALADQEAESALLCALLLEPHRLEEVQRLSAEHFFVDAHAQIFISVSLMWTNGETIDAPSIARHLRARGQLDRIGGTPAIFKVLDAPVIADLASHAEAIVEFWRRRQLRNLLLETAEELDGQRLSFDDAVEKLAGVAP